MTLEKYNKIRLAFVVVIAMIISQSIVLNNFVIPLSAVIIGSLALMLLRKRVTDIVADERDYALAGKSAFLALQIYSWISVVAMVAFYSLRDINPSYESIGMTLAFSTCILTIIYSLIFHFYNGISFSKNKNKYIIFVIILAIFIGFFSIRFFSGEDNWICKDGQWVKHGNPDFPAPTVECK